MSNGQEEMYNFHFMTFLSNIKENFRGLKIIAFKLTFLLSKSKPAHSACSCIGDCQHILIKVRNNCLCTADP